MVQNYLFYHGPRELGYQEVSEAAGALQDALDEYKRCVLAPYEERRRQENGDIWEINKVLK